MSSFLQALMQMQVEETDEILSEPRTRKVTSRANTEFTELLLAATALHPMEWDTSTVGTGQGIRSAGSAMGIDDDEMVIDPDDLFQQREDIHSKRRLWALEGLISEISDQSSILKRSFPPSSTTHAEEVLESADDYVQKAREQLLEVDRTKSRDIRGSIKALFERCKDALLKLEAEISDRRSEYPDKSAVKIDNRQYFCDPSANRHVATLIAYSAALAGRVFNGTSEAGSGFLLKMLKMFGAAISELSGGSNTMQTVAIDDIPSSITTLEQRLNLGIESIPYAICPSLKCQHLHKPIYLPGSNTPIYPEKCGHRMFPSSVACEEPLLSNGKPILTFHYYSFLDWFGRFIAMPGIEMMGDQFCEEVDESPSAPSTKRRASDGSHIRDIHGPGGEHFIFDRGKEGRWLFRLFVDDFNLEGNRLGGKHRSTKVIAMSCLNLPLKMANDPAYIYLSGLVQATVQADVHAAMHDSNKDGEPRPNPYLRPLIDDMLVAYHRGLRPYVTHGSHTAPASSQDSRRIFRTLIAVASMDLKAARPEAGLLDIMSDLYCFVCDCWHRSYIHRTDYMNWNPLDDVHLRTTAGMWTEATDENQRQIIRRQYGTRDSELWRLPYWRPTKQLVVDPMHTIFLVILPRHFRFALGIEDTVKQPFKVVFSYPFTLPPHPSKIARPTDQQDIPGDLFLILSGGDISLSLLQWELSEEDKTLRDETAHAIREAASDLLTFAKEVEKLHSLLSGPNLYTLKQELTKYKIRALHYVGNDLCVLKQDSSSEKVLKETLVKALDDWRGMVTEDSFQWPFFTLRDRPSPTAPWFIDPPGTKTRTLSPESRKHLLESLPQYMSYDSAHSIGKLHDYLTRDPEYVGINLNDKLTGETLDALRYVCVDVNRMPLLGAMKRSKQPFVDQLVQWRDEQVQRNAMPKHIEFSDGEGRDVLKRIHVALEKVVVPSWVSRPPPEIGLARAGTPKAADWRTLYAIYLPLALLSLWQMGSPIAHRKASRRHGPLKISMALTCASIVLVKQTLSEERRELFRKCLATYMTGLKEFFPNVEIATATSHIAFHIYEFMELFANSHYWWCFPFEHLIGKLQRIPKNHKLGEQEKTILHSFYKGAYFRRWLKRPDAPAVLKTCHNLLDTAYGFVSEPVLSPVNSASTTSDSELSSDDDMIIDSGQEEDLDKVDAPHGFYTTAKLRSLGNSYICYHRNGNTSKRWVAGQIQTISTRGGKVWMEVRRSVDFKQPQNDPDPFAEFWEQGFEAMMVSSKYVTRVDKVDKDWIVGHTARWELDTDSVVVLNLSQD